jgi:predicted Zn-dependent protease
MKTNLIKSIFLAFFISTANSISPLESVNFEEALWSQVQSLSLADYKKHAKDLGGDIKEHKNWRHTIDATFQKLKSNSGNTIFESQYSIIKDDAFNAFAFPAGQFIILTGLLDEMDNQIQKDTGSKSNTPEFERYREIYLAPMLAHELGHFYNRHSFKSYLAKIEKKNSKDENEESREFELDADMSGIILLQRSGYDVKYFTKMLKHLNDIRQKDLNAGAKSNTYFQTHPSPNERLSKINSEHKDLYAWAAKMEYVFADIQTSRNLENALKELDEALNTYPDNLDFQKARTVALHKIWIESALVEDLKLKSIIDLPSFRDNMVFDKKAQKSVTKKIPGDRVKFNKALTAYRTLIQENQDPWFVSNFSVLLVYSPEKQDEANALKLARSSFHAEPTVQTLNNLAFCHTLAVIEGNSKLSREIFKEMARALVPEVEEFYKGQGRNNEALQLVKDLQKSMKNKEAEEEDISAVILNLAMLDMNSAKGTVKFYFLNFDSSSKWAEFLSKSTAVSIPPKDEGKASLVDGIQIGTTIKELLSLWKEPDRKPKVEDGMEIWYYDKKSSKVYMRDGIVHQIHLLGEDSPAYGEIKIGSDKSLVEKELGKKYKKQNKFIIFEKKDKIGLSFDENKVERLLIFD